MVSVYSSNYIAVFIIEIVTMYSSRFAPAVLHCAPLHILPNRMKSCKIAGGKAVFVRGSRSAQAESNHIEAWLRKDTDQHAGQKDLLHYHTDLLPQRQHDHRAHLYDSRRGHDDPVQEADGV